MTESNEDCSAQLLVDYQHMLYEQQMQNYEYNCDRCAPHVIHNAKVFQDGDMFCCLLGENIQIGICGFGKTPEKACAEFDRIWRDGLKEPTK